MDRYIVTVTLQFGQSVDAVSEEDVIQQLKEQYKYEYDIDLMESEIMFESVEEDIDEDS